MTKSQKERLKKECEMGLHCADYESLVKSIEKEERAKMKRQKTRIARIAQKTVIETFAENQRLKQELEAKNARISELEAELKAQAEREVPDDSVSYVMDEQDKAVVEACEAELAKESFDSKLKEHDEDIEDDSIVMLERQIKACDKMVEAVSKMNDPKLEERISSVKAVLQQAFDSSYVSFEEAKLYLRAKFGMKLELDRPHAMDWAKYQKLESIDWRRKLFKEADEAVSKGIWTSTSSEDALKVSERHNELEEQFKILKNVL